jgi:hypothetical protein
VRIERVIPLLKQAEATHYFGSIELKFEDGQIVIVRRSETLKPADICRDTREDSDERDYSHR